MVAAEKEGLELAARGTAGRDEGAGGNEVKAEGTAAGPIPGPIALESCLE